VPIRVSAPSREGSNRTIGQTLTCRRADFPKRSDWNETTRQTTPNPGHRFIQNFKNNCSVSLTPLKQNDFLLDQIVKVNGQIASAFRICAQSVWSARHARQINPRTMEQLKLCGLLRGPSLTTFAADVCARHFVGSCAAFLLQNSQVMLDRFRQASAAPLNNVPVGIASPNLPILLTLGQIRQRPTPSRMPCLKFRFLRNRKSFRPNQEAS